MNYFEMFLVAVGLAMDAFAVAICLGLKMKKTRLQHMLIVGLYFGVFQGIMPLIGYLVARTFSDKIISFDHWIAFALLLILGTKMIMGALSSGDDALPKDEGELYDDNNKVSLSPMRMLPYAIATSIDALAVGVSFAFLKVGIISAVSIIATVTLLLSMLGVKIGSIFGSKIKSKAELAGGIILILIGIKILVEHLFF